MQKQRNDLRRGVEDEKLLNLIATATIEIFKVMARRRFTAIAGEQQKRDTELRELMARFAAEPLVAAGIPGFASLPRWEQQTRILDTAFLILAERREREQRTTGA